MSPHRAGDPIETPHHPVGRRVTLLADPARDAKVLGVDIWYPAGADTGERSEYELLPGVTFRAAAAQSDAAPAAGRFPLVLFSHGRTGMRFAYSLLCEALAARGAERQLPLRRRGRVADAAGAGRRPVAAPANARWRRARRLR